MATVPGIAKFPFENYTVNSVSSKQIAKCKHCNQIITEVKGATFGFTRSVCCALRELAV